MTLLLPYKLAKPKHHRLPYIRIEHQFAIRFLLVKLS